MDKKMRQRVREFEKSEASQKMIDEANRQDCGTTGVTKKKALHVLSKVPRSKFRIGNKLFPQKKGPS